jgi:DNA modification methylase
MSEASAKTFSPLGVDLFGDEIRRNTSSPIAQRFLVPPFSVLSSRDGDWQERKRAWSALGIRGEVGRDAAAIHCPTSSSTASLTDANYTSVFDPVLCELAYRWFSHKGAQVIDPFAGGSVRGVVASLLGRRYWGCDLRVEQIDANREQAAAICHDAPPVYVCGDSMDTLPEAPEADFIFSCPPYGDLEEYSDDPRDLSSMEWHTFVAAYRRIILRACNKLKPNRFACFVVGDFRCPKGFYRDFVSETIRSFRESGCELYNDAILVTPVGSGSIRVSKQFQSGRKFVKTHQNILVFCKGDWRAATSAAIGGEA